MIILDTDHISILQWEGESAERLRKRLSATDDDWLGITSITLEEQARAAITRLGQSKSTHAQIKYYSLLASLFRFFADWRVAPFDVSSATMSTIFANEESPLVAVTSRLLRLHW